MRPLLLAMIAALLSVGARAEPVQIPDAYITGYVPAELARSLPPAGSAPVKPAAERAAAINGEDYAIIAPTYNGSDGNISYIRLVNLSDVQANYAITVIGSPSGRTYGTGTIAVPGRSSPQYAL